MNSDYEKLFTHQAGKSSKVCDLHKMIPSKTKLTICDITASGVISQIYITHMNSGEDDMIFASRGVIIRCLWDGEDTPSIEVPLNDFFGVGFGKDRILKSMIWQRDGKLHMHISLPMPFRKKAVIELENITDRDLYGFYWTIEYDEGISLPDNLEYFHAQYRQSHPVPKNGSHTVLETSGHGKYVGTIWSVNWLASGCPPENSFNFFIDGQAINGENSEDYFGQSWGFKSGPFNMPYLGQSLEMEKTNIGSTQMTSYRAHLPNPILFQESFKFTLDSQGYRHGFRTDTYDTVAFWYQSHPHKPFPVLPPFEELLPIQCRKSYSRYMWEIYSSEKRYDFAQALKLAEELIALYPSNPHVADISFKSGTLHKKLGNDDKAASVYGLVISKYPGSKAAADAADRLWLAEKPGRILITLAATSGWTAFMDGEQVKIPQEIFSEIPSWGERIKYRYGRSRCLRISSKKTIMSTDVKSDSDVIAIVSDPHSSTVFDEEENMIQWDGTASSIMRLFTLRLEPGAGPHLLAVAADVSNDVPVRLESESPGGLECVVEYNGGCFTSDFSWKVSEDFSKNWNDASFSDESWEYASVYTNEDYGDAAWFWLNADGFRKFPGYFKRIWCKERFGANRTLYFRKNFSI